MKASRSQSHGVRLCLLAALILSSAVLWAAPSPSTAQATAAAANPTSPRVEPAVAAVATTNVLTLNVVSARTAGTHTQGEVVPVYKWLIVRDDEGDPTQPRYPDCMPNNPVGAPQDGSYYPNTCNWPSVHVFSGGAGTADNIVTQGNQVDLNGTAGLTLPAGKYLISVVADDFKIDGTHFTVPLPDPGLVTVEVQPDPLPLGLVRIQVFDDHSVNGQFDPPFEQGLAGFKAHIADVLGEVTTDWFGNPLCTQYDGNAGGATPLGDPIPGSGGQCVSDADGLVLIPNVGPNRYAVTVTPPDGEQWVQTATLEGSHDWDTWLYEGGQGYETELLNEGNPIPFALLGFVRPTTLPACPSGCGEIKGRVISTKSYLPPAGGDTDEGPVDRPWVALADLSQANDPLVYAQRGNPDGTYDITGVPDGTYQVTFWDQDQDLLLGLTTAVVANGATVDLGDFALPHWFSEVHGTVFFDLNSNGKQDPDEPGMANQAVVLKSRDNALVDAGTSIAVTDANGRYVMKEVYPYAYWTVQEVYNDLFYTTGVTWQADNQPTETTVLGAGVDVAVLLMDGISTRIDWGVLPYERGTNGGIVGTVIYNETRNELDAALSATEDYEAGIPGLTVNLYATVKNPDGSFVMEADGSYKKGKQLNTGITETFERPTDCQARDAAGNPMDLLFAPPATGGYECIEATLMGNQVQVGFSTVNGNYGFGTVWRVDGAGNYVYEADGITHVEDPMPIGDYLVEVEVPNDQILNRPKFQVSREEDIDVFGGDQFAPQVPPPACAGPLHIVDVLGILPDGPDAVDNPTFADAGGSPFEGLPKPLCNMKLITVKDGKSIAPLFHYFTDVPLPGRLYGAVVEDLALGTNPEEFYYGEKAGIPNAPVGVYDFMGRLVYTTQSDPNGYFDILLPSTRTFNCPLPAGPCPNVYRLVGNDPGQPGRPNLNYDPQYRTVTSNWQVWPNITLLADVALFPVAPVIEFPGSQTTHPPMCPVDVGTPQLFAVSQPYVNNSGSFTIAGQGFGPDGPNAKVTLDGSIVLSHTSWTDTTIAVDVPASVPFGPHQLMVTRGDNGASTINGLTFHVIRGAYSPTVFEVGPGKPYTTVQSALDAAASTPEALVVVYPNTPGNFTPLGDYYESIVIHSPVKLQGVGPGGVRGDGSSVLGSILNGLGFASTHANAWSALVEGLRASPGWDGNQSVYDGQVMYVLARDGQFTSSFKAAIDGFDIEGGTEFGPENPQIVPFYTVQGGGIFANAYARYLQITNNQIRGNGGSYGGAIRIGTPSIGDNHNDGIRIAHNRILANGGTNLAGAIGLFAGTHGYEVDSNDICGNFSAEYGGGISHFGLSGDGATINRIHDNRIYLNASYDEGAGVIVAGEPTATNLLSPGSGPVDIYNNVIQSNLASDDGGGLRFLMAGNFEINVYNNIIVNNVSAHEGAGVSFDDATNVRFFNNTVMKNVTTATAATSDGNPAPAGLSDSQNSAELQATLPPGHALWSDPLQFNNIFWDNRAGSWDGQTIRGIGQAGDPTPVNVWDMGFLDASLGPLAPTNSILTEDVNSDIVPSPSNKIGTNPDVIQSFDTGLRFLPWRVPANFVFVYIISADLPPSGLGNYHLQATSPAVDMGAAAKAGVNAPALDIDQDPRPSGGGFEAGADETNSASSPGLLRVTTSPAVPSQIEVDGLPMDDWALNWVKMLPGSYTVSFADLPGFTTPAPQAITVTGGQVTTVQGDFIQRGNLRVVTSPPVPSTITVDGVPSNDWSVWTDLPVASYQVCFGAVEGFDTPPCQTANLSAGVTTVITGSFSANASAPGPAAGFGLLRVETSPAVPSQIIVDGIPRTDWGLDWVKLAPGTYTVSFSDVPNYTTPPPQVVTVTAGATTTVTGTFIQRGWLRIITSPPVPATLYVDGFPRNDWGVWTSFEPGTYEVCFGAAPGFTGTPGCQTQSVTAGLLTEVTGNYTP